MPLQDIMPATGGVYRCAMPIRWGDLDALNHVNNTVYFRYFEEARVQLFRQAGLNIADDKAVLLVHASCDFIKPIVYPATIVVQLVLSHIGRTSLNFDARIECEGEAGITYAQGKHVLVGANVATGKPEPWTPAELNAIASCFIK